MRKHRSIALTGRGVCLIFRNETNVPALVTQAGEHTLVVQWRKWGSYVRAWRNSPSFLDGFAMSRFLVAMGERLDVVSQHFLTPVVLKDPLNEWHTVGGRQLEFYLHGPATALFTYGLPVTQASLDTLMNQAIVLGEKGKSGP